MLTSAWKKFSQQDILERWPEEAEKPEHIYWLPGREPELFPGDNASEADKQAWKDRWEARLRSIFEEPASARDGQPPHFPDAFDFLWNME